MDVKEKNTLLQLSRRVLEAYTCEGGVNDNITEGLEITEFMKKNAGVFVTLKINEDLRGCIGYIDPRKPLYKAVIDNTINASSRDPRFSPVREPELEDIHIEISVLSVPEEIPGPSHFEVGRHGIIFKKGAYSSVFLPQVAPEQGWSREETLHYLSRKAGLDGNAWMGKDARFEVFTAEVFHEKRAE